MLRGYECYVSMYFDKVLKQSESTACWSMMSFLGYWNGQWDYYNKPLSEREKVFHGKKIYIDQYKCPETEQYIPLLTATINEITPCQVVTIKNHEYIEYQSLATYNQNLILLNFIRNLWHEPSRHQGYSVRFFEALKTATQADPLERLTWANKEACITTTYSPGHSNVHTKSALKIKNSEQLRKYKGDSTTVFLTQAA